jgi:hypothetical protein
VSGSKTSHNRLRCPPHCQQREREKQGGGGQQGGGSQQLCPFAVSANLLSVGSSYGNWGSTRKFAQNAPMMAGLS